MRRRIRKEAVGVALFPFLAVLICTMGALVVLLVLLVQQAKVDAEAAVAGQFHTEELSPEALREKRLALEDAQWRQSVLERQRQQQQEELSARRLELSHIEDHIRRLEDSMRTLMARIKEIDQGQTAGQVDLAPLRQQLDELRRAIADKGQELNEKRKRLAAEQQSYTLIPYEGRSGTRRVPLYVECVAEGIIIQPEGVLISVTDLDGPLGPGNPLAAALGTKREFLAKATGGKGDEPYPLLVVRPSGIAAYLMAREAMKAWDDEFGYELISEDLNLDFGERDVYLDQVLHKSVQDARRRQALLTASMPRQFRQADSLPSTAPADRQAAAAEKSNRPGRGVGVGQGGMGAGKSDRYSDGQAAIAAPGDSAVAAAQAQQPPKSGQPDSAEPRIQHGDNSRKPGVAGGVPGATIGKGTPPGAANQRRGNNWGLPHAQGRTFGVTRPIRVVCLRDRMILLPDRRDAPRPSEFPLSEAMTAKELDAIVVAIQKQMEGWGLAAENGYWKPELHVEVAGDAEARFEELKSALHGSGIDVRRKVR